MPFLEDIGPYLQQITEVMKDEIRKLSHEKVIEHTDENQEVVGSNPTGRKF